MNVQDELIKIHHKWGTSEMANYKIQLLFDKAIKDTKANELLQMLNKCVNTLEDVYNCDVTEVKQLIESINESKEKN
jgi:hypothetical protein